MFDFQSGTEYCDAIYLGIKERTPDTPIILMHDDTAITVYTGFFMTLNIALRNPERIQNMES